MRAPKRARLARETMLSVQCELCAVRPATFFSPSLDSVVCSEECYALNAPVNVERIKRALKKLQQQQLGKKYRLLVRRYQIESELAKYNWPLKASKETETQLVLKSVPLDYSSQTLMAEGKEMLLFKQSVETRRYTIAKRNRLDDPDTKLEFHMPQTSPVVISQLLAQHHGFVLTLDGESFSFGAAATEYSSLVSDEMETPRLLYQASALQEDGKRRVFYFDFKKLFCLLKGQDPSELKCRYRLTSIIMTYLKD